MSRSHRAVVAALLCAVLFGLGGCSSSSPAADVASASVGELTITGGYLPQPASPDVAAAYFTVHNAGSTPDTLEAATTNVTSHVMAMTETDNGGVGTMSDLGKVVIPPHRSTLFTPGHRHLMLQSPSRKLKQGQQVTLKLTFAKAGTVTLTLPVVSVTGPTPAPGSGGLGLSG